MPVNDRTRRLAYAKQYYANNRERFRQNGRKWYLANKEKARAYAQAHYLKNKHRKRENSLRWRYGLTLEQYNVMYTAQEGKCAICKTFFPQLFVDHNHKTDQVRKLLCSRCNGGLGWLENEEWRILAEEYLRGCEI